MKKNFKCFFPHLTASKIGEKMGCGLDWMPELLLDLSLP